MLTEGVRMSFIFGHFPWAKWHMRKEKEGWHVHVNNYVTFNRDLAKRNCRLAAHKIILLQLLLFYEGLYRKKWFLMFSVSENFAILCFIFVTVTSI